MTQPINCYKLDFILTLFLKRGVLLFVLLFFSFSSLNAQKILAFDKSGKVKRIRYFEGESISLKKLSGERVFGRIDKILDSSIVVEGTLITLDSVYKIYNTQKFVGFKLFGKIFLTAGAAYFPIVTVNRLINSDNPTFSKQAAFISGSFLVAGIICNSFANKAYAISEKRPLKIIDLSP